MTDLISPDWVENDAGNTNAAPNGVQGSYSPSQIAPILRAMRGATKRFYNQTNGMYTSTGTATALVLTFVQAPPAYTKGVIYRFWAHITNTGAVTLNVNSLGAKAILSSRGEALSAGQLAIGELIEVVYDGSSFRLLGNEKHNPKFTGALTANVATITTGAVTTLTGNTAAFTGALSALSFSGVGTSLTALNASNLTSGTLANERLAGNYSFGALTLSGTLQSEYIQIQTAGVSPTLRLRSNTAVEIGRLYANANELVLRKYNATTGAGEGFIRIEDGSATGLKHNNSTVWDAGNHGASSGLDADLLDGQHGSYYRDLANSTGTIPNARIGGSYDGIDTLTSNRLRLLATNDASATSTAHAFQIGLDASTNMIIDNNEIICRENGVGIGLYIPFGLNVDADYFVKKDGTEYWHATNDGSGSGLDSDLLDGQHGSYYRDLANSTGTIPDARLAASTYNMAALNLSNRLQISGSSPYISFIDTTSGELSARLHVNSNNVYFNASSDDVTFSEVFRFELDAKRGYVAGSIILTDANLTTNYVYGKIGTLPIANGGTGATTAAAARGTLGLGNVATDDVIPVSRGGSGATSASAARTAFGLGQLATADFSDLVYSGSSASNLSFPVGSYIWVYLQGGAVNRGASAAIYLRAGDSTKYVNVASGNGTALTGTWRAHGAHDGDGFGLFRRTA